MRLRIADFLTSSSKSVSSRRSFRRITSSRSGSLWRSASDRTREVTIITGISAVKGSPFNLVKTSKPERSGMETSRKIRSGRGFLPPCAEAFHSAGRFHDLQRQIAQPLFQHVSVTFLIVDNQRSGHSGLPGESSQFAKQFRLLERFQNIAVGTQMERPCSGLQWYWREGRGYREVLSSFLIFARSAQVLSARSKISSTIAAGQPRSSASSASRVLLADHI